MKTNATKLVAGILAALVLPLAAQAASVSVILDQSNQDMALPDGIAYLEVTVSDGVDGAIDFNVQTLTALNGLETGSRFGIQQFGLNLGSSGATLADFVLPTGWTATAGDERDFDKYGFGEFDVILHTANDNRVDPLQFSIFVDNDMPAAYIAELSAGVAAQGNMIFAAHVAGFTREYGNDDYMKTINAAKFGGATVVPLPPAALMMLSGLFVMGGLARRRQHNGVAA